MAWRIEFADSAVKALRKVDPATARRIIGFLRERVAHEEDPRRVGKPLKGELRTYWRYRVGAYRLVCHIEDEALRVLVVRVGHRRDIYRAR